MTKQIYSAVAAALTFGLLASTGVARAQSGSDSSYQTSEDAAAQQPDTSTLQSDTTAQGPVRMARISYVRGNVSWRMDADSDWSAASTNLPIRQGAQIWVTDGGRAELQFDDGSRLRLGNGTLVSLQTLYSDAQGEFTEIKLNNGLVSLHSLHDDSLYQIDAPQLSVKSAGESIIRIGAGDGTEVAVRKGRAAIEGDQGKIDMTAGDYLDAKDSSTPFDITNVPGADSWDKWNSERDDEMAGRVQHNNYLPANIALMSDDLDQYGTWRSDVTYGHVWCPRVSGADWRPYHNGRWVWVNPFGWTWVAEESWGWAPYHYGTWIQRPYGWGWVPGPAAQYWSPAVVNFCEADGNIGWAPISPREIRYPSVTSFGFSNRNFAFQFSIWQAGSYYPNEHHYNVGRPWNSHDVNYDRRHYNTIVNNNVTIINQNTYINNRFVPANAARGGSYASTGAFGTASGYHVAHTDMFQNGRMHAAPIARSGVAYAGPLTVRPTAQSFTTSRILRQDVRVPAPVANRTLFRTALPSSVEAASHVNFDPTTSRGNAHVGSRPNLAQPTTSRGNVPGAASKRTVRPAATPNVANPGNRNVTAPTQGGYSPTTGRTPTAWGADRTGNTAAVPNRTRTPADAAAAARRSWSPKDSTVNRGTTAPSVGNATTNRSRTGTSPSTDNGNSTTGRGQSTTRPNRTSPAAPDYGSTTNRGRTGTSPSTDNGNSTTGRGQSTTRPNRTSPAAPDYGSTTNRGRTGTSPSTNNGGSTTGRGQTYTRPDRTSPTAPDYGSTTNRGRTGTSPSTDNGGSTTGRSQSTTRPSRTSPGADTGNSTTQRGNNGTETHGATTTRGTSQPTRDKPTPSQSGDRTGDTGAKDNSARDSTTHR